MKRYNELVPDCFPREPPPVTQSPDAAQERKYKKLCEYLDNNPDRIPKVISFMPARMSFTAAFTGQRLTCWRGCCTRVCCKRLPALLSNYGIWFTLALFKLAKWSALVHLITQRACERYCRRHQVQCTEL